MRRLWEIVVTSKGADRFYCFPFLAMFWLATPIYQFFSRRHLRKRRQRRSREWQAKVVSVGGITVGGAGKTPIVEYLAEVFISDGKKTAIVHSGYGRKHTKDQIIDYGKGREFSVADIGDEAAMLTRMVPLAAFAVGKDKKRMTALVDRECRPDVIIVDDGFQRMDMEKDIDVTVLNALAVRPNPDRHFRRLWRLFPRGVLRESSESLSRADAVFITGMESESVGMNTAGWFTDAVGDKQVVRWAFELAGATCDGKDVSLDEARAMKPYLFAGIGSYSRLLRMVEDAGIQLCGDYNFGDHFDYDKLDIDMLRRMAAARKADCYLTTAKDAVKLSADAFDKPLYSLRLTVRPLELNLLRDIIARGLS
jgi:tetraacyldisaccharide 4'-kinase